MPVISWVVIGISALFLGSLVILWLVTLWPSRRMKVLKSEFSKVIGHFPKAIEEIDGTSAIAMDSDHRMLLVGTMAEGRQPVISKIDLRQVVHCELIENNNRLMALAVRWEGNARQLVPIVSNMDPKSAFTSICLRLKIKGENNAEEIMFFHHSGNVLLTRDHLVAEERTSEAVKWHMRICELLDPANLPEASPEQHGKCVVQDKIISGMLESRGCCSACSRDNLPLRHSYFWHGVKVSETTQSLVYIKQKTTQYAVEGPVHGGICPDCIQGERRSNRKRCLVMAGITALLGWGACNIMGGALDSLGWQIIICIIGGIFMLGLLLTAFASDDNLSDQLLIKAGETKCRQAGSTTFFTREDYGKNKDMPDRWLRPIV